MQCAACSMSHVTCDISHVTCDMSHVNDMSPICKRCVTHVKEVRHTHAGRVTQMERARCGTDMKEEGADMKEAGDLSCLV